MDQLSSTTTARSDAALDRLRQLRRLGVTRLFASPPWVVLLQLFIGFGWLRAVAEKIVDPHWWSGGVIDEFIVETADATVAWYRPFLEFVVDPLAPLVAGIVVVGQLAAGISLVADRRVGLGLAIGMVLNLHFLAAGAVTPSAFYLLAQGAVALWLAEQLPSGRTVRRLQVVAAFAGLLAVGSLPFVSTVDPARVLDDPAVMLVFGGGLAVTACSLAETTIRTMRDARAPRRDRTSG